MEDLLLFLLSPTNIGFYLIGLGLLVMLIGYFKKDRIQKQVRTFALSVDSLRLFYLMVGSIIAYLGLMWLYIDSRLDPFFSMI
jgi:uncharacterized membrane protein YidH (DUF202 family)